MYEIPYVCNRTDMGYILDIVDGLIVYMVCHFEFGNFRASIFS